MSATQYPSGLIPMMYSLSNDEAARTAFHGKNSEFLRGFGLTDEQCTLFMNCGSPGSALSSAILSVLSTALVDLQTSYTPTPPSGIVAQPPSSGAYPKGALSMVYAIMHDPEEKKRFFSTSLSDTQAFLREFGFADTDPNQAVAVRTKSMAEPRTPWLWAVLGLILDDLKSHDGTGKTQFDRAW